MQSRQGLARGLVSHEERDDELPVVEVAPHLHALLRDVRGVREATLPSERDPEPQVAGLT